MRIAQISKADAFGGGASRVAEELTQILNQSGYLAHHWASWAGHGFDRTVRFPLYGKFERHIRRLHHIGKKVGFPELIPFELPMLLRKGRWREYDILHFHDLSSAISPLTLLYLSRLKPVVWTIHDCSPFTGGCLYPMDCERYQQGCGRCPQLGEWPIDTRLDFTRFLQSVKRRVHRSGQVIMATPSQWMADTAFGSGLLPHKPLVVHNGIDTERFRPQERSEVRARLGLPQGAPLVLLSAGNFLDERKGSRDALEALRAVQDLGLHLVLVGIINEDGRHLLDGLDYHETGYIGDPQQLADHYAAADLFLFPSLADNQPLVVLETMATATPVVGYQTGGIPELVVQNETGFLVPQNDVSGLAQALRIAFEGDTVRRWGSAARQRAVDLFSHEKHLESHLSLYQRILQNEFEIRRRKPLKHHA